MVANNKSGRDFAKIKAEFDAHEGMMSPPSAWLFHLFLDRQTGVAQGPILEIGTYKGKSAIVLAKHLNPGEILDLVDINRYFDFENSAFTPYKDAVKYHQGSSDDLETLLPGYHEKRNAYRFIHSDASHTFANVVNDMKHADYLLHPKGVLTMDDYENQNYAQVALAVGYALYRNNVNLTPFLVSNNKAYLCRPAERANMLSLVVNEIAPVLRREYNFIIALTDDDDRTPLALRSPSPGENDDVFGPALYGHLIDRYRK